MGRGGWWDRGGCLLTFSVFRTGAYSRWAPIRGWALIRASTVFYFALSDAILKLEVNSENNSVVDCSELTKIVSTQGTSAHFCARVQGT